tara:strand:- start:8330 stop:9301 length:972 start_codon:yes stop_codon:yes gene_type:complete
MKSIKAAVIGAGIMGKNHARVYSNLDGVNLVAISDIDTEVVKSVGEEYNIKYYPDYLDMIQTEELDVISICVPTILHNKVAMDVITKGIHVLIEKPISTTLSEADEIISAANENKIKLMVGHIERFNPVVIELKKRIQNNELGKIYKVHCERLSLFPKRIRDVGVMIDLAIHEIDILKYLISSKVKRVHSEVARRVHSEHEDLMIGTLRFENEILGVINVNWLSPRKVRRITLTGEKGMFIADYLTQELSFYAKTYVDENLTEGEKVTIPIIKEEPLKKEIKSFIECINENTGPIVSGIDGKDALKIAQKFLESSRKNEVLDL